jgi:hypothetical protein
MRPGWARAPVKVRVMWCGRAPARIARPASTLPETRAPRCWRWARRSARRRSRVRNASQIVRRFSSTISVPSPGPASRVSSVVRAPRGRHSFGGSHDCGEDHSGWRLGPERSKENGPRSWSRSRLVAAVGRAPTFGDSRRRVGPRCLAVALIPLRRQAAIPCKPLNWGPHRRGMSNAYRPSSLRMWSCALGEGADSAADRG